VGGIEEYENFTVIVYDIKKLTTRKTGINYSSVAAAVVSTFFFQVESVCSLCDQEIEMKIFANQTKVFLETEISKK
jgi:hypothetical protein